MKTGNGFSKVTGMVGSFTQKPDSEALDSRAARERDMIDLNNEIAGRDTGRAARFFASGGSASYAQAEEKKKEERRMTMLAYLLANDAQYAATYTRVLDKLQRAQDAARRAMLDISQRLDVANTRLDDMRARAAELPDGTKVFRSEKSGDVYTQEGRKLTDQERSTVEIPNDAPSHEEYQHAKHSRDEAQEQKRQVEGYEREVLHPALRRMHDEDDPVLREEMEKIEHHADEAMPDIMRQQITKYDQSQSPTSKPAAVYMTMGDANPDLPDLNAAFSQASSAAPPAPVASMPVAPQVSQGSRLAL